MELPKIEWHQARTVYVAEAGYFAHIPPYQDGPYERRDQAQAAGVRMAKRLTSDDFIDEALRLMNEKRPKFDRNNVRKDLE